MAIAIVPQLPSAASAENQKGALNKTSYDFRATVKNIGMNEMGRVLPVSELFMNSRNFSFGPKTRKTGIGPKTASFRSQRFLAFWYIVLIQAAGIGAITGRGTAQTDWRHRPLDFSPQAFFNGNNNELRS
ncbi:hypothetical protein GFL38_10435 [Rhizobium leguminosarum bv. viciae]|uniref:hypothetical protein n=1 Tax=Rhizobium ruizarguesonis TaxID=2081791 RepID=UPI00143F68DB|nr:hypothetical protein [Rhizobium ruizarguesonis]NKJ72681.1 hypothetical protein [Rhizobium leguminosarum bv. viciae]